MQCAPSRSDQVPLLSSTEKAGRVAGVGYSEVGMGEISGIVWSIPVSTPNSPMALANLNQVVDPSSV